MMSSIVRIMGWRTDCQKVSMTQVIRELGGLGLREAKSCTDRVLDGGVVDIKVSNTSDAEEMVRELWAAGADAEVAKDR